MKIVKGKIKVKKLKKMAEKMHGDLVKAIVDVEKEIMAVDASLHADLFEFLIKEENSEPKNLWGINFHPSKENSDFIEFDSMMNVRPSLGNKTRSVENEELRNKIVKIANNLVEK